MVINGIPNNYFRFQFGTKYLLPIVPCAFLYLSDVRTQADYQLLDPNFIGLIFSCFNEADKVTNKMNLAIQDESAKLCFISLMRIMCYIEPEIVLHMCYNKPVKVPSTLVYYGKILHTGVVLR